MTAKIPNNKQNNTARKGKARATPKQQPRNAPATSRGLVVKPKSNMGGTVVSTKRGLDAFSQAHLTLPRPVNSYSPLRVVKRLSIGDKFSFFAPFNQQQVASAAGDFGDWCNIVGLKTDNIAVAVNAASNWKTIALPTNTQDWLNVEVVPAAVSLRVFNSGALQTTTGSIYMGRVSGDLNWDNSSTTIEQKINNLIQYQSPTLITAAELALHPRQIDLIPTDFSQVSNFTHYQRNIADDSPYTWGASNGPRMAGFTPAFVYNPDKVALTIEVCVEFRVRFDPDSIMSETQKHYHPTSIMVWDKIMTEAFNTHTSGVYRIPGHG
jgi:hypothetical protein